MVPDICTQCGAPLRSGRCEYCGVSFSVTVSPTAKKYTPKIDYAYASPSISPPASMSPSTSVSMSASPSFEELDSPCEDSERDKTYKNKIIEKAKEKNSFSDRILRLLGF